ncbi:RICIN domain-containing protein [Dactylosporangium sp. NPDC051541]|uniref:RICIN domain-containing protein n=1 Tax=Dactylosporangium sp. NPDC051541 TaxID=3363977 RepID=UPI00378A8FBA
MTVYGGPRPELPAPKPDKLLLGAAGVALLAVIAGIVFAVQAFTSDDPKTTTAPQAPLQPATASSAAPPPPPASAAPSASPTPSATPAKKPAILAAKPTLLRPAHSGLCLQANGGNGGNTTQQGCDGNNATELWVPQAMGDSTEVFQFINAADNRCLSVSNNSKDNGAQVWIWDCHADTGQLWKLVADQGGYRLLNPNSNKCASISAGNPAPGTGLVIWDCNGALDERWSFQPMG